MITFRKQMDENFEYLGHELSDTSFRDSVGCYMKEERTRLKKRYVERGNKTWPIGIDWNQWDKLVAYWQEHETQKKFENMVDSRGVVKKVNHLGHGGKAFTEAKLINLCLLNLGTSLTK